MFHFKWFVIAMFVAIQYRTSHCQIIQKEGHIHTEIADIISAMPSDNGDDYQAPSNSELDTWSNMLEHLFEGKYLEAADYANTLRYKLINFTDTLDVTEKHYFILVNIDTNYWGTYVYNPNYCRPLVIQSPHAIRDANTGYQGIHVFIKSEALFYQVNGTHRCNSSAYSSCTGTTTSCSGDSNSEAYRISDLAHTTQSVFQKTTETIFNLFSQSYFIQLHGFSKSSTDPYVILSNGTQVTPTIDYLSNFRDHLYQEDTVLTFKLAHQDTDWTRLRGFWNTQGRLINGIGDPCNSDAVTTEGRFFHIEQERERLRSDENGWNKVANALNNTFDCNPVASIENIDNESLRLYPNPSNHCINLEWNHAMDKNQAFLIYNLHAQNFTHLTPITKRYQNKIEIDISKLNPNIYILRADNKSFLFRKTN